MIFTCPECIYFTDRKYNLQKHISRKHLLKIQNVECLENVQNVTPNVQNVTSCILSCSKCNKIYKTARHLYNHESD